VINEHYVASLFRHVFHFFVVDDILVYSRMEEEHEKHLATMLQLLREHKLYSNLINCEFFQSQIHYLGYIVSKKGISDDLDKVKAIVEWMTLRNVNEIRSIMGLVGYYRMFIKNLCKIGHPITSL